MGLIALMVWCAGPVSGQDYPNKPVRLVTTDAGGTGDTAIRLLIAHGLPGLLGQPLVVDNRPARVVGEIVAKAKPDGYTLLITGSGFWNTPFLVRSRYDPVKDFSPITMMNEAPQILVVHPSVAASSVKELIAIAKAKPGTLNYAAGNSLASAFNLAAEMFKSMAGVDIVGVPYNGTAQSITSVISGEVQLTFPSAGVVMPYIKAGQLRALAVTSAKPSAVVPGVPTMAGSGLPGYESVNMNGMFAPAGTPAAIIIRLNQQAVGLLSRPEVKENFLSTGAEVVASTPQQSAALMKADMDRVGRLIKAAGVRAE
jgi:tripartite-type tricarboxylate transporter receptor subunit TctC